HGTPANGRLASRASVLAEKPLMVDGLGGASHAHTLAPGRPGKIRLWNCGVSAFTGRKLHLNHGLSCYVPQYIPNIGRGTIMGIQSHQGLSVRFTKCMWHGAVLTRNECI